MTRARHLWHWAVGAPEPPIEPRDRFAELQLSEWCAEFEQLMRNALLMGAYHYGPLRAPGKPRYDRVSAIIQRAREYQRTGNVDKLRDVAALAMVEYVEGDHPDRHLDGGVFDEVTVLDPPPGAG